MRVRFKTNLGMRDAAMFGLKHDECCAGSEHDLDTAKAESLIQAGHVSPLEEKPKRSSSSRTSSSVRTVPPPIQTKPGETHVQSKDTDKDADE